MKSSNLGYPRIGEKREWKHALERFWAGELEETAFLQEMKELRLHQLRKQQEIGIDLIPVGDFSFYDHVLDAAFMFGIVPKRFAQQEMSLRTYFDIARGNDTAVAAEMTKWFNTNYHYIVPEWHEAPKLMENRPLRLYEEAKEIGIHGKPVLLGPVTLVKLSKGYESFKGAVEALIPLYEQVLSELEEAAWIQIDEPILATDLSDEEFAVLRAAYTRLRKATNSRLILQTYFDSITRYKEVVKLPVDAVGLDFVHDRGENLLSLQQYGFPQEKYLAAGVIDGRNVWRADLENKQALLEAITVVVPKERVIIQPSASLLHVPVTSKGEALEPILQNALAFADEKLAEVVLLAKGANQAALEASYAALAALSASPVRNQEAVRKAMQNLPAQVERNSPFTERRELQQVRFGLPLLPTTTIGSFPQTAEVRQKRRAWRRGELPDATYQAYIRAEIKKWIEMQEEIGLDVLVHGEFERTDMVEYFGEKLAGFQFTKNGWVQSYGSRCVKPPLIYGDVAFVAPMTVKETLYAQSLVSKPVKGMLTGPITILNWSFVRDDIPRRDVANQIALALREEVEALEDHGIRMIQIDEPALREGLPLKREHWDSYLADAVYAFKLATTAVRDTTQIHTHMCYSNFEDIIEAIAALDADVISIETSRSHGELIAAFETHTYEKGIGLGVYDIHSPRVPKLSEIEHNIARALQVLHPKQIWINPDCGLKTRGIDETVAGLCIMVQAAKRARRQLEAVIQ
ncbi:5-methyltetrahydropteroyltriglutamate--homocysteine S-methyltransferase [Ectobacillus antri]|uniref:5-methyltetrahydropteroyltriglutamate-- homocysteine S-methyltransferase n=1 Tax=Ectobacillus antri TaxID=2486280 RepID=UPI000F5A9AF8|nr:5-methyltetrahydropteroyltriglutamate--homocysteine S-methyltransferase [Ectobacillus antri]